MSDLEQPDSPQPSVDNDPIAPPDTPKAEIGGADEGEADRDTVDAPPPDEEAPPPQVNQPMAGPSRRAGLPSAALGILLIALGVILVWPVFSGGYILVAGVIIAIVIAGLALSLLAYWLHTARRAQGALFLALAGLLSAIITSVFILEPGMANANQDWPLYFIGLGGAVLLTFLGNRDHDRQLLSPGLLLTVSGLAALTVSRAILPDEILTVARQIAPWLGIILIVGLLPTFVRRVPRQEE